MATKAIPVAYAVPSSQSNFPVYIKPSAMTGWGSLTLAEAQSIRFYSDSGLTVELAREVVSADEIHVKVGTLTSSTIIYADYDGVRSDYAASDTFGRNAVWSDYFFVMHMGGVTESTGNTTITATGSPPSATGKIGDSTDFVNTGGGTAVDYLTTSSTITPIANNAAFSWQAWIKHSTSGVFGGLWDKASGADTQRFFVLTNYNGSGTPQNGTIGFFTRDSSNNTLYPSGVSNLNDGNWHKVTFTRTGSTGVVYTDGVSRTTAGATIAGVLQQAAVNQIIGSLRGNALAYDGEIDEMRMAKTVLSADWETTEYNNQNNVGTFWGTVTDVGGPPVTNNSGFLLCW